MQYKKIITEDTIIEFHNNWLGEETVIINGQVVSKKSSILGTHHYFNVIEKGRNVRYVLTTKVDSMLQVLLDLRRNGELVESDIRVNFGTKAKRPSNQAKKDGILKLKEYELDEAILEFKKALDTEPEDPEIYFYLACAYSVKEETLQGFDCLKKAVHYNLQNTEMILNHDMLAYIRMHEAFEEFLNSNFSTYNKQLLE